MAEPSQKVLNLRMRESDDSGVTLEVEFGVKTVEKKIPSGRGLVRASVIFEKDGSLSDVELVTEKV
jgi:hypothetical protein